MPEIFIYFLPLLFVVAFLYSSIGHGGASGYLALMGLFSFETAIMKGSALTLNLFVASVSFYHYWRAGHFSWKLFYPFIITSIPCAFIGGMIDLDPSLYKKILGVALLIAIARIVFFRKEVGIQTQPSLFVSLVIGAGLGLVSGMIGIGGGIILSPIILLLHWGNMKETAAVSALFIFVNSAAGLGGMMLSGVELHPQIMSLVVIAFCGGLLGAYSGANKFANVGLRNLLAVVLLIASLKLFFV